MATAGSDICERAAMAVPTVGTKKLLSQSSTTAVAIQFLPKVETIPECQGGMRIVCGMGRRRELVLRESTTANVMKKTMPGLTAPPLIDSVRRVASAVALKLSAVARVS
jgi:hypothetical protein